VGRGVEGSRTEAHEGSAQEEAPEGKREFQVTRYRVHYYAGSYSGHRDVEALDAEHAIAIVRARIRREMSLPMYADGYRAEQLDPT